MLFNDFSYLDLSLEQSCIVKQHEIDLPNGYKIFFSCLGKFLMTVFSIT